jgi:xylan 1,4-beta-xylosidase
MCAADAPDHPIQKTGHGQYVETHDGQFYHTFLMGRPIPGPDGTGRFCPLGRETGIERVVWGDDDWLYLEGGGMLVRTELPGLADVDPDPPRILYGLSGGQLPRGVPVAAVAGYRTAVPGQ